MYIQIITGLLLALLTFPKVEAGLKPTTSQLKRRPKRPYGASQEKLYNYNRFKRERERERERVSKQKGRGVSVKFLKMVFKWAIPRLFLFIFVFSIHLTVYVQ